MINRYIDTLPITERNKERLKIVALLAILLPPIALLVYTDIKHFELGQ